jgi:hypothetical protein
MSARHFEVWRGEVLVATAATQGAAQYAAHLLAAEARRPWGEFVVHYPPDHRFPILGGGTASAAEIGLPLSDVAWADVEED